LKDLLYVGGGVTIVGGLEGSLLFVLDLSGIVGGFKLFNFNLDLCRVLGSERQMQNDRLTLIRQLAIFQFLGVGGVSLEGSGGSEFDGVDGGFGELVRQEIYKIRRC